MTKLSLGHYQCSHLCPVATASQIPHHHTHKDHLAASKAGDYKHQLKTDQNFKAIYPTNFSPQAVYFCFISIQTTAGLMSAVLIVRKPVKIK